MSLMLAVFVYASLSVTDVGRETVSKGDNVMLPKNSEQVTEASIAASETSNSSLNVSVSSSQGTKTKTREGKGCHLLPLVNHLMQSKENWKAIITKENYHFLGTFTAPCQNFLWYTEDVTQLGWSFWLNACKLINFACDLNSGPHPVNPILWLRIGELLEYNHTN